MSRPEFVYDVVAYPSHPLQQTHPERLAAIGMLFGMSPTPVERCRVLELGGGDGSNIIPLGLIYPDSSFTGIDLASTAVAKGNATIGELDLRNVKLLAADLLDLPNDLGKFDYIIAHGLFSWVPPLVRDKILSICREYLSPNGIAYISYNALPGCHIRRMLREMMRHHVRHMAEPAARIEQALAFIQFLAQGQANDTDPFALMLRKELNGMTEEKNRAVLFHDDLAEINQPFHFHEFMALAAARDLQFLAEADFVESADQLYPPEIAGLLREMGEQDPLEREQYLDFLKCRRFRQTLLVRKEINLDRKHGPQGVRRLAVSSRAKPDSASVSLQAGVKERFREAAGAAIALDLPLAKATFVHLGAVYPQPVRFADLVGEGERIIGKAASADDVDALAAILNTSFAIGLIELHAGPPTFVRRPGERPIASPLARMQLRQGEMTVTSLRHSTIQVENPLTRQLLLLLDGTRDRVALLDSLVSWATANPPPDQPARSPVELRKLLAEQIEPGLQSVAAMGLLVG